MPFSDALCRATLQVHDAERLRTHSQVELGNEKKREKRILEIKKQFYPMLNHPVGGIHQLVPSAHPPPGL